MSPFIIMLRNVLVFLALAVPGYMLVKLKILKEEDTSPISKVLVKIGLPSLIFANSLNMNIKGWEALTLVVVALVSLAIILITVFISTLVTKGFEEKTRKTAKYAMSFSNSGFLGIPLAEAVFGSASSVMGYLVVANVVCCVGLNTIGVYLFTGDKKYISIKKILLNPAFLAFFFGIVINLSGVLNYVNEITLIANHLKGLVTPISMMIVGIKLASIKPLNIFKSKNMYIVSAVKLLVQPIIIVCAMLIVGSFINIPSAIIMGIFMAFAMPAPGTTTSFADMYDGDVDESVIYTLGTTILSVISIPILYYLITLLGIIF